MMDRGVKEDWTVPWWGLQGTCAGLSGMLPARCDPAAACPSMQPARMRTRLVRQHSNMEIGTEQHLPGEYLLIAAGLYMPYALQDAQLPATG